MVLKCCGEQPSYVHKLPPRHALNQGPVPPPGQPHQRTPRRPPHRRVRVLESAQQGPQPRRAQPAAAGRPGSALPAKLLDPLAKGGGGWRGLSFAGWCFVLLPAAAAAVAAGETAVTWLLLLLNRWVLLLPPLPPPSSPPLEKQHRLALLARYF